MGESGGVLASTDDGGSFSQAATLAAKGVSAEKLATKLVLQQFDSSIKSIGIGIGHFERLVDQEGCKTAHEVRLVKNLSGVAKKIAMLKEEVDAATAAQENKKKTDLVGYWRRQSGVDQMTPVEAANKAAAAAPATAEGAAVSLDLSNTADAKELEKWKRKVQKRSKVDYQDHSKRMEGKSALFKALYQLLEMPDVFAADVTLPRALVGAEAGLCGTSKHLQRFLFLVIIISTISFMAETSQEYVDALGAQFFWGVECFCVIVFSIELLCRIYIALDDLLKFFMSWMTIVDVICIVPWYVELVMPGGSLTSAVRVFRIFRLLRIFKISRQYFGVQIVQAVMQQSRAALVLCLFTICVSSCLLATLLYVFETEADPPTDGFASIPQSLWFVLVTLTTVGYGDVVPKTTQGKNLAMITVTLGIIIIAMPLAVVGNNFVAVYGVYMNAQQREREQVEKLKQAEQKRKLSMDENTRLTRHISMSPSFQRRLSLSSSNANAADPSRSQSEPPRRRSQQT